MKKLIAILVASSLAFAAAAYAKPEDAPKKKSAKSGPPQQTKQQHVKGPRVAPAPHVQAQRHTPNYHSANVNPAKIQRREFKEQQKQLRKSPAELSTNAPAVQSQQQFSTNHKTNHLPAVQSNQMPAAQLNKHNIAPLSQDRIQAIRAQHQNFHAQRNASIAGVRYNQNYQIAGSQNWTGPQYRAFQTYRPQWHDQNWYRSSYGSNLRLIGGGWYYWNSGYWYPAWGYDESAAYYPYDGPIYVGQQVRPFDQVVADVQATLQEQGYYRGEVDGLMGPLTRSALADFQRDHGLISTAALDEPTLASLGLG
ncbi:MAG: peptidoglycan-binding protein [Chthoniobacterales bacterium]